MTIRNTLAGGRGAGVFTALGVATGQAAWTLATCTGLAALLLASEPAFLALKLVGAGYLVFLGAQALLVALSSAQFAPGSGTSFFALLLLGLVFCSLTLAWLAADAMAVAKAGDFLRQSGIRRAIQGLTGAVLIALGLRIATER